MLCTALVLTGASAGYAQNPGDGSNPVAATFDPNGPFDNDGWGKDPGNSTPIPVPDEAPPPGNGGDAPEGGTPPANDVCSSATVIPANAVVYNPALLNTTGATNSFCDPAESCEVGSVGTSNSVWYSYTPALSGTVVIDTGSTAYNTVLSVFDGCGGGFPPNCSLPEELACNDDYLFGTTSQVTLAVEAGHNYRIKVSDYNTADGGGFLDFNLHWYPPNDICANATVIPNVIYDPPTYSTVNADIEYCEAQESCEVSGAGVGHTVWYSYTAPCDGMISINTNGSSYDTVLSVWDRCGYWAGVDFPCNYGQPAPVQLGCDDDSGTGLNSQIMNLAVTEGGEYLIKVAAYGSNAGGTLNFNFMFAGANPPTASISSPVPFGCVCGGNFNVTGTAAAGLGPLSWTLDYQPIGGSGWTIISTGTNLVLGLTLGTWNTAALPQGNYMLRLTVLNACALVSTAVVPVFVDQAFDSLDLRAPLNDSIIAGTACIDGTVWDQCFSNYTVMYRPQGGGVFMPVNSGVPTYTTPVLNDPLAGGGWNTVGIADGNYELRVQGTDQCGHVATVTRIIKIDNTAPVALITSPVSCAPLSGTVAVMGTANDLNLAAWALQYTGGSQHGWVTIASGNTPVINGLLGMWNTSGLPACDYTLHLVVGSNAIVSCDDPQNADYLVSVHTGSGPLGCPVDLNGDGDEDLMDFAMFQNCFTGP
ncbi:MAG TPA: hypothetical protein VGM03_23985 [Phycisphaerae bacterium]